MDQQRAVVATTVEGRPNRKRYCAACDRPITKHTFPSRMGKQFLWCSFECYKWKPPRVIAIELRYGSGDRRKDIRQILIETTGQFDTLGSQCRDIGVSIPYLYTMVDRYFGMKMRDFVQRYGSPQRRRKCAMPTGVA